MANLMKRAVLLLLQLRIFSLT